MRRSSALLLVLFGLATPAFARVLSYAPYTDRQAKPAIHERTSRYFALVESPQPESGGAQLVLYDTVADEPRVIYPQNGGFATIHGAALREVTRVIGAPLELAPQVIILAAIEDATGFRTILSSDAGRTWKDVELLRGIFVLTDPETPDYGGPFVRGPESAVRFGPAEWPFVLSATGRGVVAVAADGNAKVLATSPSAAIGQNADGSRALVIQRDQSPGTLVPFYNAYSVDVRTGAKTVVDTNWSSHGYYHGWITPDGSVYVTATRNGSRFLYMVRDGNAQFIAGPRGVQPGNIENEMPVPWRTPESFFAVPTADFSGAWMIQRDPGMPTNLLRHTWSEGVETMWSDPAGPEVEALIPGRSGQTVLIQVHRDRSAVLQRQFVDPALAVWRVGDPMPRAYDELYLNEELDKSFVHVDVDGMTAGAPFVFYSGTVQAPDQGPISPSPIGGGGDVIQEWGVVRGSLRQRLILPGVARAAGAFNSLWRTDVTVYNGDDAAQEVEVRYVGMGAVASTATATARLTLQPREIRFIPDVLQSLFGLSQGGGALHFVPTTAVNVFGRTYTRSGEGTYGFGMIAIDEFNSTGPRFPLSFAGAFPGDNFRTNILITDTSGRGTSATLNAYGVTGAMGAAGETISAPAGGISQFNGLGSTMRLLQRESGGLVVEPTSGTAIVTVVAMDNRTNDPTYFPPDLPSGMNWRSIPVIGHLAGAHGAQFRSDLYLYNPAPETRTVVLEARSWDGIFTVQKQFTLLPREARLIPDALMTLFQRQGVARLRYMTLSGVDDGVRVTSRAYTVDESGATYGSLVPPFNNFQLAASGESLEILGATAGPGFRTNLGLIDHSQNNGLPVQARIRVFDEQHRQIDTFTVSVPRNGGMQINDIFASRGVTPPTSAVIVVDVLGLGLIGAYGTLTDNVTNDTTFIGANLAAQVN